VKSILISLTLLCLIGCTTNTKKAPAQSEVNQFILSYQQKVDEQHKSSREAFPLGTNTKKSFQWFADLANDTKQILNQLDYQAMSEQDKITFDLFERDLALLIADNHFKTYQIPFTSEWGFVNQLDTELGAPINSIESLHSYLNKLNDVPRFLKEHQKNMQDGMARGFMMPRTILKTAIKPVLRHTQWKSTSESSFYQPVAALIKAQPELANETIVAQIKATIETKVIPAFASMHQFMKSQYLPAAPESIAATERVDGHTYYQQEILKYTTLTLTPDEIHSIGLNEVKRIRAEMEQIIKSVEFKGSFDDFILFLRTDPQFYAKSERELLMEASLHSKKADSILPRFFKMIPRQPYAVNPVPADIAPFYTTGRYVGAPISSTKPGQYWVNTYALDKRPLYVLEALTLHEAVPGHHFTSALTQEMSHLPEFRQNGYISAFGEGWALYCEYLGVEAGFYQDPYSQFGRLTYEMWRAIRLVVDTGMHAKGWTRQQAINFMKNNTALSTHNVRTEIDRYISWPAQALSYKLGEIKIKQLRARAEQALGENFDIREFHHEVLRHGSITLSILESNINKWIDLQKQSKPNTN
jgi:uncharacterized protein (DUF885 family)